MLSIKVYVNSTIFFILVNGTRFGIRLPSSAYRKKEQLDEQWIGFFYNLNDDQLDNSFNTFSYFEIHEKGKK